MKGHAILGVKEGPANHLSLRTKRAGGCLGA